jgi:hypothetical protein
MAGTAKKRIKKDPGTMLGRNGNMSGMDYFTERYWLQIL